MSTSIWWIRRDLRLGDATALQAALQAADQTLPVFVLDPTVLNSRYVGEKRMAFLFDGLRALDKDLRQRGSRLIVCSGNPATELTKLCLAATAVFYGQPITDPAKLKALSGPFLGIFGGADSSIPADQVAALKQGLDEAGIQNEIKVYDGQPHAFVGGMDEIAKGGAPQEAWNQLLAFLKMNLQERVGTSNTPSLTRAEAARGESSLLYVFRLAISHLGHGM